jgi:hypothetical protein
MRLRVQPHDASAPLGSELAEHLRTTPDVPATAPGGSILNRRRGVGFSPAPTPRSHYVRCVGLGRLSDLNAKGAGADAIGPLEQEPGHNYGRVTGIASGLRAVTRFVRSLRNRERSPV